MDSGLEKAHPKFDAFKQEVFNCSKAEFEVVKGLVDSLATEIETLADICFCTKLVCCRPQDIFQIPEFEMAWSGGCSIMQTHLS